MGLGLRVGHSVMQPTTNAATAEGTAPRVGGFTQTNYAFGRINDILLESGYSQESKNKLIANVLENLWLHGREQGLSEKEAELAYTQKHVDELQLERGELIRSRQIVIAKLRLALEDVLRFPNDRQALQDARSALNCVEY